MNYLCGCSQEEKSHYSADLVDGPFGQKVLTNKRYDADGFEVCPEHGYRLKGWYSNFHDPKKITGNSVSITPDPDIKDTRDLRTVEEVLRERAVEKAARQNGKAQ